MFHGELILCLCETTLVELCTDAAVDTAIWNLFALLSEKRRLWALLYSAPFQIVFGVALSHFLSPIFPFGLILFLSHQVKFNDWSIRVVRSISHNYFFFSANHKIVYPYEWLFGPPLWTWPRKLFAFTRQDNIAESSILYMNVHDNIVWLLLWLQQGRDQK